MKCTAKNRAGKRCGRDSIPGGRVCNFHGGGAPQVQTAARLRLAALVDPAIGVIAKLLKAKKPSNVNLAAARDILDRNGLKPKEERTLDAVGETLETLLAVYNRIPDGSTDGD